MSNDTNTEVKKPRAKLSAKRILAAAERMDGTGFCLACGHEHSECEPDARQYECERCGLKKVYGAEELLIMGLA